MESQLHSLACLQVFEETKVLVADSITQQALNIKPLLVFVCMVFFYFCICHGSNRRLIHPVWGQFGPPQWLASVGSVSQGHSRLQTGAPLSIFSADCPPWKQSKGPISTVIVWAAKDTTLPKRAYAWVPSSYCELVMTGTTQLLCNVDSLGPAPGDRQQTSYETSMWVLESLIGKIKEIY